MIKMQNKDLVSRLIDLTFERMVIGKATAQDLPVLKNAVYYLNYQSIFIIRGC
jgi:hypothetical protein